MSKVTLTPITGLTNGVAVAAAINANFDRISDAFERCLFRDGTEPNQMEVDLDLNHNTLRNAVLGPDVTITEG